MHNYSEWCEGRMDEDWVGDAKAEVARGGRPSGWGENEGRRNFEVKECLVV